MSSIRLPPADMISCGSLVLNGQQLSDFNISPTLNFGPGSYDLIQAGFLSGSLGSNTSGTIDGLLATLAVQGNDLVLNVVPEPSTLGAARRRRRRPCRLRFAEEQQETVNRARIAVALARASG